MQGVILKGLLPEDHDTWFRAKVQDALDDPRPAIPAKTVEAYFKVRRDSILRKFANPDS